MPEGVPAGAETLREAYGMKRLMISALLFFAGAGMALAEVVSEDACSYGGICLYGRVQVVNAFADLKVQEVDAFADLRVQVVSAFPDSCGKWMFVESFPDFTVQFVEAFPDIKIQYVDAFPGMP